jgi:hypothetical protein
MTPEEYARKRLMQMVSAGLLDKLPQGDLASAWRKASGSTQLRSAAAFKGFEDTGAFLRHAPGNAPGSLPGYNPTPTPGRTPAAPQRGGGGGRSFFDFPIGKVLFPQSNNRGSRMSVPLPNVRGVGNILGAMSPVTIGARTVGLDRSKDLFRALAQADQRGSRAVRRAVTGGVSDFNRSLQMKPRPKPKTRRRKDLGKPRGG